MAGTVRNTCRGMRYAKTYARWNRTQSWQSNHHMRAERQQEGRLGFAEIASFLDDYLRIQDYPEEPNGMWVDRVAPVRRIGLALDPSPDLGEWARGHALDVLILHRAWRLDPAVLPPGTGVLAYHLPFDEHLTLGFNPLLAAALGMADLEVLGRKQGRPIGMIGNVQDSDFAVIRARMQREFGGVEEVIFPRQKAVARIAVVGAMTDALVREAAARGVALYLSGQLRAPARGAAAETGIGVVAVGHRRSEEWGLRTLAALLNARWSDLEVWIEPSRTTGM